MIDMDWKINLTEMMQDKYTDLDIYREKPEVFKSGNLAIVIAPVTLKEHDIFLEDMAILIYENIKILKNLEFLSSSDYKDTEAIKKLIDQVALFKLSHPFYYKKFKEDAVEFLMRWAYVIKIPKKVSDSKINPTKKKLKRSKKLCEKVLDNMTPDSLIKALFLMFVFNFDIVKKNTLEFFKMFHLETEEERKVQETKQGTSSSGNKRKVVQMPRFSEKPFNKSTLNLLEKQSRLS